jgi:tetratricopeptide (TPR) repeat protein
MTNSKIAHHSNLRSNHLTLIALRRLVEPAVLQPKLIWLFAGLILVGTGILTFVYFIEPLRSAQRDRNWRTDRLDGQRHWVDGDYKAAEGCYTRALADLDDNNPWPAPAPGNEKAEKLAVTLNEWARIEYLLNNYAPSEDGFSKAKSIFTKLLYGGSDRPLDPITLQTAPQNLREGALKSMSGIARTESAMGKKAEAKKVYESLLPIYLGWWQSRKAARSNLVMCSQAVGDLSDLAAIYMSEGNTDRAQEVCRKFAEICSTTPIASDQKAKANEVYHHVFGLNESDPGITDEF